MSNFHLYEYLDNTFFNILLLTFLILMTHNFSILSIYECISNLIGIIKCSKNYLP